ncbi:hypothetical protein [Lysobacter gummosus]|uniref:hypothetical protein n=1 Tax=Lysobacter gummosus TaxID=262324 RepID=UPI00363D3A52
MPSQSRHSRERGLRFTSAEPNIQRLQSHVAVKSWIPAFAVMTSKNRGTTVGQGKVACSIKALDPRLRGDDEPNQRSPRSAAVRPSTDPATSVLSTPQASPSPTQTPRP